MRRVMDHVRGVIFGLIMGVFIAVAVPASSAPLVQTADGSTTTWTVKQFTLNDGRTYYADVPSCASATDQACADYMATPKALIFYLHPLGGAEDATFAANSLNYLHSLRADVIFVYGVSAGGTKAWTSGVCCTKQPVDDVGYLVNVVQQLRSNYAINPNRVGSIGVSNGGMMTEKAVCDRPDVFKAGASYAGTYSGDCKVAVVKLAQWHGTADTTVPFHGGTVVIGGVTYTFPDASSLAERMVTGSTFSLFAMSGYGHQPPGTIYWAQIIWVMSQFVG